MTLVMMKRFLRYLFFFSFYESFIPKMAMHVPHEFYCKVLKTNIECFNCWSFLILLQVAKDVQVDEKEAGPVEWTSYWKPNITINLLDDFTRYNCLNISSTDFLSVSWLIISRLIWVTFIQLLFCDFCLIRSLFGKSAKLLISPFFWQICRECNSSKYCSLYPWVFFVF